MQTLADFWQLAGSLVEAPADYEEKAWRQGEGGSEHLRAVRDDLANASTWDVGDDRSGRCARVVDKLERQAQGDLPAGPRGHDGHDRVAGHLRVGRGARPRRDAGTARQSAPASRIRADLNGSPQPFVHRLPIARGDCGSLAPPSSRPRGQDSAAARHNEGHGRRLTAAFEALEAFPALAESRNRVLRVVREERSSVGEVVQAVESDVALVITVLRIANRDGAAQEGQDRQHPRGGRDPHAGGRGDARGRAPPPSTSSSARPAGT